MTSAFEFTRIVAYCDGACEPVNPGGHAAWGVYVVEPETRLSGYIGQGGAMSNNVAEYAAVVFALRHLWPHRDEDIEIRTDSQLVVKQLTGEWQVKGGLYHPWYVKARTGLEHFPKTRLVWVPREQNSAADNLTVTELAKRGVTRARR